MRTLGKRVQFTSRVSCIFDAAKVSVAANASNKAKRAFFHYARTLDCGVLICRVSFGVRKAIADLKCDV